MLSALGKGLLLAAVNTVVSIGTGSWPRYLAHEQLQIWPEFPALYLDQAAAGYAVSISLTLTVALLLSADRLATKSALRRVAFYCTFAGWVVGTMLPVLYLVIGNGFAPFIATGLVCGVLSALASAAAAPTVFEVLGQ